MMRIIVIIGAVIITLSFLNIDIHEYIKDIPILSNIWDIGAGAWTNYIKPLFTYLITSITGLFK